MNAVSISAEGQLDDHCRLTFAGEDWWKIAKAGDAVGLVNERRRAVLDISNVDWPAYIESAEALMLERRAR